MILKEPHEPDAKPTGKAAEAAREARLPEFDTDAPPPYAPAPGPSSSSFAGQKPSNYVSIHRTNGSIKSTYLLDPTLSIPAAMLPVQSFSESMLAPFDGSLNAFGFGKGKSSPRGRKNLDLQSTNGPILVDVTIPPVDNGGKKVLIYLKSTNGNVELKLHRSTNLPAVRYDAYTTNGSVRLALPRSFQGPIFATRSNGQLKPSPEVSSHMTSFSDVKGTHKFFVGDVREYMQTNGDDWKGDECYLETCNGHVKVCYEDEVDVQEEWASNGCCIM